MGIEHASFFTGIGGFDIGFELAGIETISQCEIDKNAITVLEKHWPGVERYKDIATVHLNKGTADIITGGFPCQDLSVAGKREGLSGERSGLFFELVRVVDECRPRYVVWENVPGLLSSNGGRDFATVLSEFAKIGYFGAWRVLDSQYFGVAQRRRRVFGVFAEGDSGWRRAGAILLEPESRSRNIAQSGNKRQETPGNIEDGVAYALRSGKPTADSNGVIGNVVVNGFNPQTGGDMRLGYGELSPALQANQIAGVNIVDDGLRDTAFTLRSNHGQVTQLHNTTLIPCYYNGEQVSDTLDVSVLSKQQMMPEKSRFAAVIDKSVRRLTPVEYERLQGFPDNWTAGQADTQRYKQIGNAITVNVAYWIGLRIVQVEEYFNEK